MKKLDLYIEFYYNTDTKFLTINEFIAHLDRVMNKIPQLYELTCKIFENDVESLKKQWFDIIEDKEVI